MEKLKVSHAKRISSLLSWKSDLESEDWVLNFRAKNQNVIITGLSIMFVTSYSIENKLYLFLKVFAIMYYLL